MINLLDITSLEKDDIHNIWAIASEGKVREIKGNIAWSFEGNGIRTRTTFIQAFQNLGLSYVELPNFLKTGEPVQDLAGYMDSFYSMYIIRDNDHKKMVEFSSSTERPVINAMSSEAHPCEVLTDAYYLNSKYDSLQRLRILLWGPVTNVFKSWQSLSKILGLNLPHYCLPRQLLWG
jgi:ornithine carbamoyltransferase